MLLEDDLLSPLNLMTVTLAAIAPAVALVILMMHPPSVAETEAEDSVVHWKPPPQCSLIDAGVGSVAHHLRLSAKLRRTIAGLWTAVGHDVGVMKAQRWP